MNKKPYFYLKKKTLIINTLKPIPNYRATTPFCVYNYLTPPIFGLTYPYFYMTLFYPSITERILDRALAKEYMVIPLDKVEIIEHCRKTLLFYEDSVWIKKGEGGNFDTSIGAYDRTEICELVVCIIV